MMPSPSKNEKTLSPALQAGQSRRMVFLAWPREAEEGFLPVVEMTITLFAAACVQFRFIRFGLAG